MADYVVARGCIETNGELVARAGERYAPKSEAEAERLLKDGVLIAGVGKEPEPEEKPEPEPEEKPEIEPEPEPAPEEKPEIEPEPEPAPEEKSAAKGKAARAKAAQK